MGDNMDELPSEKRDEFVAEGRDGRNGLDELDELMDEPNGLSSMAAAPRMIQPLQFQQF
jgi:hypothetical protein